MVPLAICGVAAGGLCVGSAAAERPVGQVTVRILVNEIPGECSSIKQYRTRIWQQLGYVGGFHPERDGANSGVESRSSRHRNLVRHRTIEVHQALTASLSGHPSGKIIS